MPVAAWPSPDAAPRASDIERDNIILGASVGVAAIMMPAATTMGPGPDWSAPTFGPMLVVDDIARMSEIGVRHLELAMPPGPTTGDIVEQMHRFAQDVRPQLPKTS